MFQMKEEDKIPEEEQCKVCLSSLFDKEFKLIRASLVAQSVKNLPVVQETQVWSLGQEELLEKEMATHSNILTWKIHGQRSLVGCSPWGPKESGMTEWLTFQANYHKAA